MRRFFMVIAAGLAAVPLFAAPANDSCQSATIVQSVPQTIVTSLAGATASPDDVPPPCASNATEGTVWYRFTAGSDQQVRMDTSPSTANTVITAFVGGCDDLQPVACDWHYGTNNQYSHGMVDFLASAGQTYHVMISGVFQPNPNADAVLDVSPGQSHPVTVEVREAETSAPVPGARVWVRDTLGGNYTLADGFTGSDGTVMLFPPNQGSYESHVIAAGRVVEALPFTNGMPAQVEHWLEPTGAPPLPAEEPARIAFSSDGLRTMRPDGSDERVIVEGDCIYYPTWSPDGSRIVFGANDSIVCATGGVWTLWVVNADGSGLEVLNDQINAKPLNLDWSPDGQWVTYDFYNPSQGFSSVHKVDAITGAGPFLLKTFAAAASWSPDSSMLVYGGNSGTRLMQADGSNDITITSISGAPNWSPDGTRIAAGGGNLYAFDLDGTNVTLLAEGDAYDASWSPDGSQLVFSKNNFPTRVDADGSGEQRLRWQGGFYPSWSFSPSNDVPGDFAPKLQLLDPNGGEWLVPGETFTIRWDAWDDNGIVSQDLTLLVDLPLGLQTIPIARGLEGSVRSLDWVVPDIWSHLSARVRIEIVDDVGQDAVDQTKYWFSISDGTDPYVMTQITHPAGGEALTPGSTVVVTWETDSYWSPTDLSLELSLDGGFSFTYVNPFVSPSASSFVWTVPDVVTDRAVLRLKQNSAYSAIAESGFFTIGLVETRNLRLEGNEMTELTWDSMSATTGSVAYDIIRGDLAALDEYPGTPGWVALGDVACVAAGAGANVTWDEATPAQGTGYFYLVQESSGITYGVSASGKVRTAGNGDCP